MSFLNSNNSEYLSARITNRGRKAIANGNFNIQYFQIGDSEYDYNTIFSGLTGTTGHQKVFAPFDYESGVKYPYSLGSDISTSTTYGTPISNNKTVTLRNEMGTAGFVSNFNPFGISTKSLTPITGSTFTENFSGTTLETIIGSMPISGLTGTNQITFTKISGVSINPTGYTTLVLKTSTTGYTLDNDGNKVIKKYISSGKTNSFIYRYSGGTTGTTQTITLDRNVPNLGNITGLTGNVEILNNNYEGETLTNSLISPIDYNLQLNSWTLNTVWTDTPIGGTSDDETLVGYNGNQFISIKNYLGYTKTGQTFGNYVREKIQFNSLIYTGSSYTGFSSTNVGSGFANSFNELIEVTPSEQRCLAIVHYSELGDISIDPERFFKYDDYISHCTDSTDTPPDQISQCNVLITYDSNGDEISDTKFFEVYIPFINYHRSTSTNSGALFTMDTKDYYLYSSINSKHQLKYRYLIDEQGYIVGKVFVNNKTIVFDDQELVAILDYRSNRKYTLPSPKLGLQPIDGSSSSNSMLSTTGSTAWVTYMFENLSDNKLNSLPCNYFNKITSNGTPSQITMKFNTGNTFTNMTTTLTSVTEGFVFDKFYALVQTGTTPTYYGWKKIDLTSQISNYTGGTLSTTGTTTGVTDNTYFINPNDLLNKSFIISYSDFNSATTFDLETHLSGVTTNYLGTSGATDFNVTLPQFGDEQPFPGSVRLVRATDIEEMTMMINLPSSQFTTTQNPTWINELTSGKPFITEVALLDSNKEPLVVAKTPTPVKRTGTQVFAVKLDF
jgi:hypothetical protein